LLTGNRFPRASQICPQTLLKASAFNNQRRQYGINSTQRARL